MENNIDNGMDMGFGAVYSYSGLPKCDVVLGVSIIRMNIFWGLSRGTLVSGFGLGMSWWYPGILFWGQIRMCRASGLGFQV